MAKEIILSNPKQTSCKKMLGPQESCCEKDVKSKMAAKECFNLMVR